MSFDTKAGTRGSWQPRGRLLHWANLLVNRRIRRGRNTKFMGFDALVLRTVGRRSGEERFTPLGWFPAPDGSRLIVAAAAGAPGNPAWYYNLAAHPDDVRIEVGGETLAVRAEQLHGAEREEAWQLIVAAAPRFADYQVKTDRELPVIRLIAR
ncbi:nitroreductase/quinone reductase family protein [Kribbella sp. GL6]|uniref:nitroreductase/quinone reductase family protein n=1 Tax=Kribbella sp. GL6 TaxID=3419765 RepID=UPI003CFC0DD1